MQPFLWSDSDGIFLDARSPLPLDQPFTPALAEGLGVSRQSLRSLHASGHVRRVLRGVYAAAQAPNDLAMRCAALAMVVPAGAVVTDRTAAWLHGIDILPRTSRETAPPLEVFRSEGDRLRRRGTASGTRGLAARDVVELHGLRVTTPLRTACDLGRLQWRFDALAALDGFIRAGVDQAELLQEVLRFRGYRGVRQLRMLAPLCDPLSESPGESALRLHWYDAGLPRPTLQHWVCDDAGTDRYRLDVALPELRYAAEYDGVDFHSTAAQREHDSVRRSWLQERAWVVEVFERQDVYAPLADPVTRLRRGAVRARSGIRPWEIGPRP